MDGMKVVQLPQDRPRRTQVPQDRAHRQRHRPREPDYPRKPSLPGIPAIAWPARDPPPQRSASSDAPANQIARIAQRRVVTQSGSIATNWRTRMLRCEATDSWSGLRPLRTPWAHRSGLLSCNRAERDRDPHGQHVLLPAFAPQTDAECSNLVAQDW